MLLVGVSFSGCNNFEDCITHDSFQKNVGESMVESSIDNKMERESSENVQKQKKKDYEMQDFFVVCIVLFLLLFVFVLYYIFVVRKLKVRLNELEERVNSDEKKRCHGFESLKEQRINKSNFDDVFQRNPPLKNPDNPMIQESPALMDEKAVVIEFPLEKESGKEYKYLMPSFQGRFNKLLDEPSGKTRFRCWMENGGWHFEFHGDLKTAIENYNATFDETCIVEGSYNGATHYEIEKDGTLDKNLQILTKSIIRLY